MGGKNKIEASIVTIMDSALLGINIAIIESCGYLSAS
jgi:hypothetical protein